MDHLVLNEISTSDRGWTGSPFQAVAIYRYYRDIVKVGTSHIQFALIAISCLVFCETLCDMELFDKTINDFCTTCIVPKSTAKQRRSQIVAHEQQE
jgi:hypothetical protein